MRGIVHDPCTGGKTREAEWDTQACWKKPEQFKDGALDGGEKPGRIEMDKLARTANRCVTCFEDGRAWLAQLHSRLKPQAAETLSTEDTTSA
jgi:hypothetical protein